MVKFITILMSVVLQHGLNGPQKVGFAVGELKKRIELEMYGLQTFSILIYVSTLSNVQNLIASLGRPNQLRPVSRVTLLILNY